MDQWYCVYTKPNCEDALCKRLSDLAGMEVFSPKMVKRRTTRSGPQEALEPLFPCYLFTRFEPGKYFHTIRYTRGVRRFVGNSRGDPYTVDHALIDSIKSKMEDGLIRPKYPKLHTGQRVRITEGLFAGLDGLLVSELDARERVMILLHTLECHARVEVHRSLVAGA